MFASVVLSIILAVRLMGSNGSLISCGVRANSAQLMYFLHQNNVCYFTGEQSLTASKVQKTYSKTPTMLMYRVVGGSGVDPYAVFTNNTTGSYRNPKSGNNYRSSLWDSWSTIQPSGMIFLAKDGSGNVVVNLTFAVRPTDSSESWFVIGNLVWSYPLPMSVMKQVASYADFNIRGLVNRVFAVYLTFNSCVGDVLYFATFNPGDPCSTSPYYFKTNIGFPVILYAKATDGNKYSANVVEIYAVFSQDVYAIKDDY